MSVKNGMYLYNTTPENIKEGLWWEEHCIRRQGGYDFDVTNLPSGYRYLPKGAVLGFNASSGKAYLIKSAVVNANAALNATTLTIVDNGLFKVGDKIAGSTISAISVDDGVATLTVGALAAAVSKDDVVDSTESDTIYLGLNYDTVDLRDNTYPQVTPTLQALEIEEDTLPYPVNSAIKTGLGALHQFKIQ